MTTSSEASALPAVASASLMLPVVVATGNFMTGLDQNVVITALPAIGLSLNEAPAVLSLTITAYVAALIIALPIGGWASERFGARNSYCFAVLTFTLASALCGFADSFWTLVAARALQGFGGALMGTVGQVVVLTSFPRSRTLKINTYISMAIQVAPMVGPIVGGALTTYLSWRWIFYLNVPFGLFAAIMAGRMFPAIRRIEREPFDIPGFALIGIGTALLVFGMNGIADGTRAVFVIAELVLAIVILALAARHCLRARHPLIDLRLLEIRTFRIAMMTGGWFDTTALTSVMFLLPLMLQLGFGMNAVEAGSLTFLAAVGSFVTRPLMPTLLRRFGFRTVLVFNTPVLAAMMAGFAFLQAWTPLWFTAGWIVVFGMLRSVQWASTGNLSYSDVPQDRLARFSALYFVLWQMSVAISVGAAAAMIALLKARGGQASTFEFHIAFLVEAAITVGALVAYSRLRPGDGRHVSGHADIMVE